MTIAGVAQAALVSSLQVIISLLFRFDNVTVVKPLVPGILIPFLNQLMVGDMPPLLELRLNVAVWFAQIFVLGEEILILCVRFVFTVI